MELEMRICLMPAKFAIPNSNFQIHRLTPIYPHRYNRDAVRVPLVFSALVFLHKYFFS